MSSIYNYWYPPEPTYAERALAFIQYPFTLVGNPLKVFTSIPALSFLIIPAFSSYTTTLQLFFFYLTWATLILSNPPLKVELYGTLAIRLLFYVVPSLFFLAFDSAVPSAAASIKQYGDIALPMSEEQGGVRGRWWKIGLISIGNVLLGVLIQGAIAYFFVEVLHIRSALKITTSLPMPWGIVIDLFRGLFLRELLTYVLHRYVLHNSSSPFASYHETWYHSLTAPYSIAANYDHPLAYIFHVFLPTYLPAALCHFHLLTYHMYLAIISIEETFAYSGYNVLPSGFILGGIARRQERHLMGDTNGNYGCYGICDFVAGSSVGTSVVEDVQDEADKKDPSGKAKKKVKAVGKKGKKRLE